MFAAVLTLFQTRVNLRKQLSLLQTLECIYLYISVNIVIAEYMLVELAVSAELVCFACLFAVG